MAGARSAPLIVLLAAGVAGMAWLVWGLVHDVEVADTDAVVDGEARAQVVARAPPPVPVVEPPREVFDGALIDHVARWARSPLQQQRWTDAIRLGGEGLGRFERRLWIGELLEHLARDTGLDRTVPEHAHELFAALFHLGVLSMERWGSDVSTVAGNAYGNREDLLDALSEVTRPARSRHAFRLHGFEADPLATGRDLRLRVWTPRMQSLDPKRVQETLSLLQRLDVVAGVDVPAGVDLLASASRGDDVFPTLTKLPFRFIGVYLHRDRLAVVGTQHPPEQLRRLIQHEVIHAWHRASRPRWNRTFVIEGLATYASHLFPSDEGLVVPAERLRSDLAWLRRTVARLESRGVSVGDAHLGALIRAKPWEFYALGWFGYVVAEACFAYVGPQAIEEALRSGGEEALLVRLRAIRWSKLVGWADEQAKGGDPDAAWVVTEGPLPGQERPPQAGAYEDLLVELGLPRRSAREDVAPEPPARRPVRPRPTRPPASARSGPAKEPVHPGRHFLSQKGCKKCHFRTHRSWKRSPHAGAYLVLAPGEAVEAKRKAGLDPERDHRIGWTCLPCHTTGYGTPSGYPVPRAGGSLTDELRWRLKNFAHVGCEACHGMGSEYAPYKKDHEDYRRRDLVARGANIPIRAEHCVGCHKPGCPTMPADYAFDFEASLRRESFHEEFPLKHDHGPADSAADSGTR